MVLFYVLRYVLRILYDFLLNGWMIILLGMLMMELQHLEVDIANPNKNRSSSKNSPQKTNN